MKADTEISLLDLNIFFLAFLGAGVVDIGIIRYGFCVRDWVKAIAVYPSRMDLSIYVRYMLCFLFPAEPTISWVFNTCGCLLPGNFTFKKW